MTATPPDARLPVKRRRLTPLRVCALFCFVLTVAVVLIHYPYATDPQHDAVRGNLQSKAFYEQAYAPEAAGEEARDQADDAYVKVAERAAEVFNIKGMVRTFVDQYQLKNKRVLDVGAGRGYLQDMVEDYTGLDISPTAARYFHKPFVLGSATAMPFSDGEFDAIWSIWVLEHILNPESALREMRRVLKPGGVMLLFPAWFCTSWAAEGYEVRPYRALDWQGRVVKATIPLRSSRLFRALYVYPIRVIRLAASRTQAGPASFHYRRLKPNYERYWVPDSDAVNSMDPYEAILWFASRGDRCLNCRDHGLRTIVRPPLALIIQVKLRSG